MNTKPRNNCFQHEAALWWISVDFVDIYYDGHDLQVEVEVKTAFLWISTSRSGSENSVFTISPRMFSGHVHLTGPNPQIVQDGPHVVMQQRPRQHPRPHETQRSMRLNAP